MTTATSVSRHTPALPVLTQPACVRSSAERRTVRARALWNGVVIAESSTFETVEGNVYFPGSALKREYLTDSPTTTVCPWKGTAHYYNVVVNGMENRDAAWYYPEPKAAAAKIAGHVAFWRGIEVQR